MYKYIYICINTYIYTYIYTYTYILHEYLLASITDHLGLTLGCLVRY